MNEFDIENLRRIRVEPGDILVLTMACDISAYEAHQICDSWRERVDVRLLLLANGAQLSVLNASAPTQPVTEVEVPGGTVEFPAELGVTAAQAEAFRRAFEGRREQSGSGGA